MFNRQQFIGEALDSVLNQSLTDFEVVVVDDASTDNSVACVQVYNDDRIRLISNEFNKGISASRNLGIAQANGKYIAFLDSDDRATPDRLKKQMAFLEANPDHAAVGGWLRWIDENGYTIGKTKRKAAHSNQIAAEMLFRSGIENSAAMGRTSILQAYPHRDSYGRAVDYDLWARLSADYKLATLSDVLLERRKHPHQSTISKADPEIKRGRLKVLADQLDRLGVGYTDMELENHYLLRRMHKEGFWPDRSYVLWARQWLKRLKKANKLNNIYPEPAFSRVLGLFWLKTCARGFRHEKGIAIKSLLKTRLALGAPGGLFAEAQTRLRLTR